MERKHFIRKHAMKSSIGRLTTDCRWQCNVLNCITHTQIRSRTLSEASTGRLRLLRRQIIASSAASSSITVREAHNRTANLKPPSAGRQGAVLSAIKAGLCAAAFFAWWKISATRSASLFCSTAVAARSASAGTAGSSAIAGLAAGCLHSLSGPDHLAALTPLTIGRSSVRASLLGAWWGFGHCIGQLILGLLMLLLKDRFHNMVPYLDKYSSVTIGLTLILIGILGLVESLSEDPEEVEVPQQTPPLAAEAFRAAPRLAEKEAVAGVLPSASGKSAGQGIGIWTLATGIVYGLQPDALFVIVPALALPTKLAAAAYMGMFVAGTVAAMGSYTAFIGATSRAIQSKGSWFKVKQLSAFASLIALIMGISVAAGGSVGC